MMFEVTEKAVEMIQDFLKDRSEEHIIRITMNEGG
jgi:Fe-S cluster assembly iron-binding protein IscA